MRKKENNITLKAIIGTMLAVFLSISIFIVVDFVVPFRQLGPRDGPMELANDIFLAHTAISFLMIALSVYLLFTYLKDYLELKSRFTIGVLLAVFSFMLFAIAANPPLHMFLGVYGGRGLFQLVPYVFATIALAILVWVSSR
ncbi:hypothetical protein KKE92_02970 [Candidatus Micrarchaeota archaeon]|nr:hypothetical protein [Candidatus Micrarchaeota archaeon]MBU1681427.1 hypothetical protein [Candidatus Micrarchaeota archaeon]